MKKKNLVFISAVVPSANGNGLNLRALRWLHHFLPEHNIYLLLCPIAEETFPNDSVIGKFKEVIIYQANRSRLKAIQLRLQFKPESWIILTPELKHSLEKLPSQIDYIFCLRMYNLPLMYYLSHRHPLAKVDLDLDELESKTRYNTCKTALSNGAYKLGLRNFIDSFLYKVKEYIHLPKVPHIHVSTLKEMQYLKGVHSIESCDVFFNKLPMEGMLSTIDSEEKNILFVGNLGHYPNVDAVEFIVNDILPRLKNATTVPFKFYIVGKRAPQWLSKKLAVINEIVFLENIEDIREVYAKVHMSIVPLKSGGGSSFKVLESLKFGRPIVATTIGIRGFDLRHGEHVLIGEDASDLVENVVKLFDDKLLAESLRLTGYEWVKSHYMYDT